MKRVHLNYLKFGTAVTQVISNTFAKFEADRINEWTNVTGNILLSVTKISYSVDLPLFEVQRKDWFLAILNNNETVLYHDY